MVTSDTVVATRAVWVEFAIGACLFSSASTMIVVDLTEKPLHRSKIRVPMILGTNLAALLFGMMRLHLPLGGLLLCEVPFMIVLIFGMRVCRQCGSHQKAICGKSAHACDTCGTPWEDAKP